MTKRVLSFVLAWIMVFGCFGGVLSVGAEETNTPAAIPAVAYYTFDERNLSDSSGNGYDAVDCGAGTISFVNENGRGRVLELNNSGATRDNGASGIRIPSDGITDTGAFSVVVDAYVHSLNNAPVWLDISKGIGNTDPRHYLVGMLAHANYGINSEMQSVPLGDGTSNTDAIRICGGGINTTANAVTFKEFEQWVQLAFVQEGTYSKVYLDGKCIAQGDQGHTVYDLLSVDGTAITIGMPAFWPDRALDAKIDNVGIYDIALTEEQLDSLAGGSGVTFPDDPEIELPDFDGIHGLRADFYSFNKNDYTFGEHKGTYIDENIAFSDISGLRNSRGGSNENVCARWSGQLVAPEDGSYTFYGISDNGIRLYLDGELIIDWWVNEWDKEQTSKSIALKRGEAHDIVMEWFDMGGGAHVTLRWKNNVSIAKQPVPATAFYLPEDFNPPAVNEIDTSAAQLDRGQENFGGELKLVGQNLDTVTQVEVVSASGSSLDPAVYLAMGEATGENLTVTLPDELKAGTYKLRLISGDVVVVSESFFTVVAAAGESDRPEHPRPDWFRDQWMSLNGWWDFGFDASEVGKEEQWFVTGNGDYDQKINVPFPWESELSGVTNTSYRGQVWYQRTFNLDESWFGQDERLFVYFGAVDAICTVYVNGNEVGSHNGGYTQFEFDITDYVTEGENQITVWVEDEASYGDNSYPALVGKQGHNAPCGYTHTSGIWQSVYLESRTATYLDYAHANPDVTESSVQYDIRVFSDEAQDVTVKFDFESMIWDEEQGMDISTGSSFTAEQTVKTREGLKKISLESITIENAKLWSDTEPNLYYGTITVVDAEGNVLDCVDTYFGLRQVSTEYYADRDYQYVYLNGEPVFQAGLLDQGFFDGGVYTAPSEEALKNDILQMKNRGFNMIRKHLKIEDPLQYYWCDKLGMFVWQDMPHATAMNTGSVGGKAPGRDIYEDALEACLMRDYNHPSVIMVCLFNETWGINHNGAQASDGLTTHAWMQEMYYRTKDINPNLLVEDMSPCNEDKIQPTDVNTFHMYEKNYHDVLAKTQRFVDGAYVGSEQNFWGDFVQEGEPLLNSEYGGVGAYEGDYDVSLCYKYQTDIQRQFEIICGYVYTEPYDIEYERNGILTYDRREKVFGYDEIAYGGDMTMADLNQPNYVGIKAEPAKTMTPGSTYTADAIAVNWSGDKFENAILKWRFDATDIYGNYFSTGISGESAITYEAYTAEDYKISFKVPSQNCVGTLTVWVEENGEKIAKNFINIIVDGKAVSTQEHLTDDTYILRTSKATQTVTGTGSIAYEYTLPASFKAEDLSGLRLILEASSVKGATVNHGVDNSANSQTVVGGERPSDMTVTVNGVEVDTVFLPDNPRDIRGTLTINDAINRGTSAGNYGYLVNISIPAEKLADVAAAIAKDGKVKVTYSVDADAEHQNGLRIYDDGDGRYTVQPTVILNPTDLTTETGSVTPFSANYTASAVLSDGNSLSVRGGLAVAALNGGVLTMGDASVELGGGEHLVTVKIFDDHYQVYADNNPVPVMDTYIFDKADSTAVETDGAELIVAPETYNDDAVANEAKAAAIAEAKAIAEAQKTEGMCAHQIQQVDAQLNEVLGKIYAAANTKELQQIIDEYRALVENTILTCPAASFTDVNLDAWYHEPIDFVLANGMMTGDKEGTFRPDVNISRAQVAQILYNMAEDKTYEAAKIFSDVKDGQWFYDAVMWAAANGFVLGDDGADTFRPDAPITRQELVVIIWRYMGKQAPANAELTFADAAEAESWAVEAIAWASENEFVKGLGDNKFAPKANASRAQMTQILMNIFG